MYGRVHYVLVYAPPTQQTTADRAYPHTMFSRTVDPLDEINARLDALEQTRPAALNSTTPEDIATALEGAEGEDVSSESFSGVVGGHGRKADGKKNDGQSILLVDGLIYKPCQAQAKVDSAVRFYEAVRMCQLQAHDHASLTICVGDER